MKDVPLVSGMRQTREVVGEKEHVMPRRHVAGVACFQLVVQALHQLILGSGGGLFIYTHFDSYGEGKCYSSRCTACSVLWRKTVQKKLLARSVCVYTDWANSIL